MRSSITSAQTDWIHTRKQLICNDFEGLISIPPFSYWEVTE